MSDPIEVWVGEDGRCRPVGLMRVYPKAGTQSVTFEYDEQWLREPGGYALDPGMPLVPGIHTPHQGQLLFGALSDTAPDQWGRRLLRRREMRQAALAGRAVRPLMEVDYLLGVTDTTRMGALRFRRAGETEFQAPAEQGVPTLIELRRLLSLAEKIDRDEAIDEDVGDLIAQGSSLGGARPKASIRDDDGALSIAKFPKLDDAYSVERWERVAMILAERAGITVAANRLIDVLGRKVLLSRRFDRNGDRRIGFASAMALTESADGEKGSYLEVVDVLDREGLRPRDDKRELYQRIALSVLISNVDDHLRNHGFLRLDETGWALSPAYDINPVPRELKAPVLSTAIDFDDARCSVELLLDVAEEFALSPDEAERLIRKTAEAVRGWREVAKMLSAPDREIALMRSAFEHEAATDALAL